MVSLKFNTLVYAKTVCISQDHLENLLVILSEI